MRQSVGTQTDGTIEFLGRKDGQIKIRGMRVQLAEIEQCLMKHENIKACCVTLTDRLATAC